MDQHACYLPWYSSRFLVRLTKVMQNHLGSRFSERFSPNASAKPVKGGTIVSSSTEGGTKRGYSTGTLTGNWCEERWDSMHTSNHPALGTELESTWRTTAQEMTKHAAKVKPAVKPLTQRQLVEVADGRHRCFPGHQPEIDPKHEEIARSTWRTETREVYGDPALKKKNAAEVDNYIPPTTGADAQAYAIIHRVRVKVLKRSNGSFTGLRRSLRIMDTNKNLKLNDRELQTGMARYGVQMSDAEMKVLMRFFDKDGNGEISLTEFVRGVRGDMNERRRTLVEKAYKLLDSNKDGIVKLNDIEQLYDVSQHPEVLSGKLSKQDALRQFMAQWDINGDDIVSLDEFIEYYNDVSAQIDADHYFELMIRNAWHISGGEGVCANTSCRRVLVIHTNGRQTVEEIKNDLGIGPNDKDKMLANLAAQGITDVARIELKGAV